ncbi:MAG: response regulator, partial [Mariprofundus sp.]
QEIKQAFGFNHAWIYLMSNDPDRWQLLRSDLDSTLALEDRLPTLNIKGDAMLEAIAAAQGPVIVEDAQTDPRCNKEIVSALGNRTIINVPIILADSRLGTLGTGTFGSEGLRVPDAAQLEHLSAMASHAALALDRVQLFAERLDMQAQLEHTQRLDSLGLMAGGIAHDFNNILTSIMGNAAVAEKKVASDPESIQTHLGHIVDSSKRAADLCNQMLAYSGKGHFVVEMVDLSRTFEETAPFLEASVGKHVQLIYQLHETLPMIEVDIAQIQQVIMNLVINASEAITENSGCIRIKTGLLHADETYLEACYGSQPRAGTYVFLEVADNGCGMDSATADKVFDPFFTTKFTGRGLGMSAILGIVRGHHGAILLDSELGKGTTFRILFPALEACPLTVEKADAPIAPLPAKAQGTILVIDDEITVRELAACILQDDGFAVLNACDGKAGVDMYQQHQDEISLVLLDLTMPRMSGTECYHELRRINPDVKVILVSGYSEDEALGHFEGFSLSGFISKPFMPKALSEKVFAVLSA